MRNTLYSHKSRYLRDLRLDIIFLPLELFVQLLIAREHSPSSSAAAAFPCFFAPFYDCSCILPAVVVRVDDRG
ncbi:hypothetical protein DFP73DRAFT_569639 [Morchella snyderi]|nr:hypothetical protein DFP73DRAFT_569639 [Morchella snyderi]